MMPRVTAKLVNGDRAKAHLRIHHKAHLQCNSILVLFLESCFGEDSKIRIKIRDDEIPILIVDL